MKLRQNGEMTTVQYAIQIDFGGRVPSAVTNAFIGSSLGEATKMKDFFQSLRTLEEWDAKDGEAMAEILVVKTEGEKHHGKGETKVEARMREMMRNHAGLRELGKKREWFEVLLAKTVENKLRPAGDSKAKLCNMSEKQARVIGGALASCIAANLTAPAAVDEWILRYPAMGELDREYVRERAKRAQKRASGSGAPRVDANNRRY
jgi:hypothetical protein